MKHRKLSKVGDLFTDDRVHIKKSGTSLLVADIKRTINRNLNNKDHRYSNQPNYRKYNDHQRQDYDPSNQRRGYNLDGYSYNSTQANKRSNITEDYWRNYSYNQDSYDKYHSPHHQNLRNYDKNFSNYRYNDGDNYARYGNHHQSQMYYSNRSDRNTQNDRGYVHDGYTDNHNYNTYCRYIVTCRYW
uniref:Probable serine/threonine-protein kinase clkA-like n=1 Tax=Saccoglossus kowalevskii TaxID=10224 RepID=A0ABM0N1C6_SACKO|nr:PREDICTED: probable serine/threonine-protein kinase clkA-like [Saccoglossus kowalevskii]